MPAAKAASTAEKTIPSASDLPPRESLFQKVPIWAWVSGTILVSLIGFASLGGFSGLKSEPPLETETIQETVPAANQSTPSPTTTFSTSTPTATNTAIPEATITPWGGYGLLPSVEPLQGSEIINPVDGAGLVYVPSGDFYMGSEDEVRSESPVHMIYLDGFWIYKTEVTNAMYRLCVNAGKCDATPNYEIYSGNYEYDDHPAAYIDWKNANDYCVWAGGRLPTEAEWEKAARGTDERTYTWGEGSDPDYANYQSEGTAPVGSYPEGASPYGALDLAGNVKEWVADWYQDDYYSESPEMNPEGPADGVRKVLRGGSWNSNEFTIRSSYRSFQLENDSSDQTGFRCLTSHQP